MPVLAEEWRPEAPGWRVEVSVAAELFWVVWMLANPDHLERDDRLRAPAELLAEMGALREAGLRAGEVLVLADLAGVLSGTEVEAVFAAVENPRPLPADLPLVSETEADRADLLRALRLVTQDRRLRRRLVAVLRQAWQLARPAWETEGLEACAEAVARVRQQLRSGTRIEDLMPPYGKKDRWLRQTEAALSEGRLLLVPTFFGGSFLAWDLPSSYLLGFQARPVDRAAQVRARATKLAARLKVLGDPTRLAILMQLAHRPATVTEVAQEFGIAQPTVSTHLKLLRDAGLVSASRDGGRTVQVADLAAVEQLLGETRESVAAGC